MFAKNLLQRAQNSNIIRQPVRTFQQFSKNYQTGFDRMLLDKFSYFRVGGWWFAIFGVANIAAYGLSQLMSKDNYVYHFGYKGDRFSLFNFVKSQFGSNTFSNVAWTAPTLIALNWYLKSRGVSNLVLTKFFALSLFSSYIFLSALSPKTGLNVRPAKPFIFNFDSYGEDYTMGADQLAQSLCYFTLLYHGYWTIALPFMAFDLLYYGPSTLGGPFSAIAGAFMFL